MGVAVLPRRRRATELVIDLEFNRLQPTCRIPFDVPIHLGVVLPVLTGLESRGPLEPASIDRTFGREPLLKEDGGPLLALARRGWDISLSPIGMIATSHGLAGELTYHLLGSGAKNDDFIEGVDLAFETGGGGVGIASLVAWEPDGAPWLPLTLWHDYLWLRRPPKEFVEAPVGRFSIRTPDEYEDHRWARVGWNEDEDPWGWSWGDPDLEMPRMEGFPRLEVCGAAEDVGVLDALAGDLDGSLMIQEEDDEFSRKILVTVKNRVTPLAEARMIWLGETPSWAAGINADGIVRLDLHSAHIASHRPLLRQVAAKLADSIGGIVFDPKVDRVLYRDGGWLEGEERQYRKIKRRRRPVNDVVAAVLAAFPGAIKESGMSAFAIDLGLPGKMRVTWHAWESDCWEAAYYAPPRNASERRFNLEETWPDCPRVGSNPELVVQRIHGFIERVREEASTPPATS